MVWLRVMPWFRKMEDCEKESRVRDAGVDWRMTPQSASPHRDNYSGGVFSEHLGSEAGSEGRDFT